MRLSKWSMSALAVALTLCATTSVAAQSPASATAAVASEAKAEPGEIVLAVKTPQSPNPASEHWYRSDGARNVHNVSIPTLTPFLPEKGKANGVAVIVAPGGGFMSLSMDSEGYEVARWLASHGVTAFVLKYRLQPTPATQEGLRTYAIKIFTSPPEVLSGLVQRGVPPAVEDAQAAMRLVRANAADWGVDPKKIGFMGFSAGAFTTLGLTYKDDPATRPDFIAPIYGPMGRPDQALPKTPPPMWVALSSDDPLFGKSDFGLVQAWRDARAPVELHYYEKGGHGWGFKGGVDTTTVHWREHFLSWLQVHGWAPN